MINLRVSKALPVLATGIYLASGIILAAPAAAQTYSSASQSVEERLNRVESAIYDLQGTVYSVQGTGQDYGYGSTLPAGSETDLTIRVAEMERQLQALTGRVEELAWKLDQNAARLDTLSSIASGSTTSGSGSFEAPQRYETYDEPYLGESQPAVTPPSDTAGPADLYTGDGMETSSIPLASGADGLYDQGFNALLVGDYMTAEAAFEAFLQNHSDDPRAPDVQFRLGEIYLATGADQQAARAFLNHVKTWPDDARAQESYLKLGTALNNLGKGQEACKVFALMDEKFTGIPLNLQNRLATERSRAGCAAAN